MNYWKTKSIKTKLILSLSGLLTLTLIGIWSANQLFLPVYYQYSKVTMLSDSFRKIDSLVSKDASFQEGAGRQSLSEDSLTAMESLAANGSMSAYLFQINNFFGILQYTFYYPSADSLSNIQKQNIREKTMDYVTGVVDGEQDWKDRELIRSSKNYQVFKAYDERIGSYYLELFGQIESGDFVYISTNYQSMQESVGISNRFLAYIGLGAIVISGLLLLIIGDSFTRPIKKMTDIATRMSQLDFDAKYPVHSQDEIGRLGSSINTLSERLEETISELKAANNELQKDIEKKIQIDEMRKDFLSNVSHELKTPIALIQGYAEGLHDNINEDSESREFYCDVIMDEADKMNKMVKKLLTLNQIEFGNDQITFERFDIVELVQSVIQSATLLAQQKEAEIYMEQHQPIYVWGDEYMVEEVVTNYISNALNHVAGEKRIRVTLELREEVVRVRVFNTGAPIPEDELDKIWIKFYKVDKARTRAYGGSGIGLSIVKAIVESMHQQCGVTNHSDGVEFWFDVDRKVREI
jgi:signal transduction histidine kinase